MRKRVPWMVVALIGFLLMVGTAGASDLNEISIIKAVLQVLLGLGLFALGLHKGGVIR